MISAYVFVDLVNLLLIGLRAKMIIQSVERSEDSYIGLADFFCLFFFREKILKFHAHFGFFAV